MYILIVKKIVDIIYNIIFFVYDKIFYLSINIDNKYIDYIMKH